MMTGVTYGGGGSEIPEQHLADRIVGYWATAKRKIECELRLNVVGNVYPSYKVTWMVVHFIQSPSVTTGGMI